MSVDTNFVHKIVLIEDLSFGTFGDQHQRQRPQSSTLEGFQGSSKSRQKSSEVGTMISKNLMKILEKGVDTNDPTMTTMDVIKIIRTATKPSGTEAARLLGFAKKLKELDHVNLVKIVSIDWHHQQAQGCLQVSSLFLKTEYFHCSLDNHLAVLYKSHHWSSNPLRCASHLILDLYRAVTYLHGKKIVHQNLSPKTIFVHGGLKVGGFGGTCVAQIPSDYSTDDEEGWSSLDKSCCGSSSSSFKNEGDESSLCYKSPEQMEGKEGTVRSDIYSVGLLTYAMIRRLRLRSEMAGAMQEIHNRILPSGIELRLQQTLKSTLFPLLAQKPKNRPAKLDESLKLVSQIAHRYGWCQQVNKWT